MLKGRHYAREAVALHNEARRAATLRGASNSANGRPVEQGCEAGSPLCITCTWRRISRYCEGSSHSNGGLYDCSLGRHMILRPEHEYCNEWEGE